MVVYSFDFMLKLIVDVVLVTWRARKMNNVSDV